jgi:predicted nucleotidyltransferase
MEQPMREFVSNVLDQHYQGYSFSFFYGSRVKNDFSENSDFDLIVLFEEPIDAFRENFVVDGKNIDAFVHGVENFNYLLQSGTSAGNIFLAEIIRTAEVIPSKTDICKYFIEVAESLKDIQIAIPDNLLSISYLQIENSISDLERARDEKEKLIIAISLTNLLTDVVLRSINFNKSGLVRKHALKALKQHKNDYLENILSAYRKLLQDDEKSNLIEIARGIQSSFPNNIASNWKRIVLPETRRLPINLATTIHT